MSAERHKYQENESGSAAPRARQQRHGYGAVTRRTRHTIVTTVGATYAAPAAAAQEGRHGGTTRAQERARLWRRWRQRMKNRCRHASERAAANKCWRREIYNAKYTCRRSCCRASNIVKRYACRQTSHVNERQHNGCQRHRCRQQTARNRQHNKNGVYKYNANQNMFHARRLHTVRHGKRTLINTSTMKCSIRYGGSYRRACVCGRKAVVVRRRGEKVRQSGRQCSSAKVRRWRTA